jgi:hypothetical protein
MAMKLNGSVQITRTPDRAYSLAYAPFGANRSARPARRFDDSWELERFLAGPLRLARREVLAALTALDRNGSYVIWEIWLSADEVTALA